MFKLKKLLAGILIGLCNVAFAQQPEIYNQFYMNPYLYNPAYAGVEGHSVLFAMYHQQWSNIEGAPTMIHASFHTPLEGGIGIGAAAFNYNQGLLDKSVGKVSASYLLTLDLKHYLRFGLSIGGGTQSVQFSELDDPTDPAFLNLAANNSFAVADFGVTYHFDHFNIGISLPNLVSYDVFQGENFAPVSVRPQDNAIFKMNYRGHITDDLAIEPHLLYRYNKFLPDQYEATVIFHIYHIVWAGATYRQDNNIIATVGTKIKEKIGIGYAYEMGNTAISNFLGPTHEIHVGYHIGSRKDHAEHAFSFIKSHRLSAKERAEQAAIEREKELQELQAAREAEENEDESLGIVAAAPEPEPEEKSDWQVDTQHEPISKVENGVEEEAFIVEHQNEAGETEYAVAWRPKDENWEMITDEKPRKRTAADGTKEVGIKYVATDEYGVEQQIIKWEPVLNETQLMAVLEGDSEPEQVVVKEDPIVEPEKPKSDWKVDREHQPISKTEDGVEEEAFIVEHQNEEGETEYAVAWRPKNENWEMVTDEVPEKRTNAAGEREVGIKYIVTAPSGETKEIAKWEPVLNEEELNDFLNPKEEVQEEPIMEEPVEEEPVVVDEKPKSDWKVDTEHQPISKVEDGVEEEAFIVEHQNQMGETEYAVAWRPKNENWEMVTDEVPEKRTNAAGEREVGIKYVVTDPSGQTREITKWEPVLTEQELNKYLNPNEEATESEPVEEDTSPIIQAPEQDEDHIAVNRGDHMLELPSGIYVIAGAFSEFDNAEKFSDQLFLKGYRETIVGYVSEYGYYYVVIHRSSSMQDAQQYKERVNEKPGMDEIWVLKVN